MYDLPDLERFVQVRPGLWRCTIIWAVAYGIECPVATFLVDSGAPTQVERLLKAIDVVFTHANDTLRYICITHAHIDHTGAAPALLEKYPQAKAVMHVEEKPFICHGKSLKTVQSDTWTFSIMKHLGHDADVKLPEDRVIALRDGDKWEFDHVIKFVETPGHTPGSSSFIHIPSRSILVGDAVMNIAANPLWSKIPCISGPMAMSTCHWGNAMEAITKICSLKDEVDTVFPAHDYSMDGIHITKVHEFHHPHGSSN
ncbi:hypothetical protein BGW38_005435 [Lunasporangiospora selenospora]|uniref:Metallo-beta-lactamase domain-containing protein n=1 Tax=Lunasporangiospora selenospora TaxID=979761 RepID=A0A9P6FPY9_9FUNG|nr:hypothetical protein BGW38_005435 [Lunasporangiospora selenospora]